MGLGRVQAGFRQSSGWGSGRVQAGFRRGSDGVHNCRIK